MTGSSRILTASFLSLGVLSAASGLALAAPVPAKSVIASAPSAQSLIEPVHYRCWVRRCGPYRCVWVNRCRRYWW